MLVFSRWAGQSGGPQNPDRLVLANSLGGPTGDDCGKHSDGNENDCATYSDEVETGNAPRAEDADQQRDAGDQMQRCQTQRGAVACYPCLIAAHRRRSADADELIASEAPVRARPVNYDDQRGQEDESDGDEAGKDEALSFH